MIIQATSHGTEAKEEPFAFTYSGDFTDNRVDGVGTVRLNTSGTLTVTGSSITVTATIVGGGGGGAGRKYSDYRAGASGGGGGIQTVEVTLEAGTYDIVIGTGGAADIEYQTRYSQGGNGGDTTAFGKTSTGGTGGYAYAASNWSSSSMPGVGGTPNGGNGSIIGGNNSSYPTVSGGTPNGGNANSRTLGGENGGDGYVELTFS